MRASWKMSKGVGSRYVRTNGVLNMEIYRWSYVSVGPVFVTLDLRTHLYSSQVDGLHEQPCTRVTDHPQFPHSEPAPCQSYTDIQAELEEERGDDQVRVGEIYSS
jgi:hypothetical protein